MGAHDTFEGLKSGFGIHSALKGSQQEMFS